MVSKDVAIDVGVASVEPGYAIVLVSENVAVDEGVANAKVVCIASVIITVVN